MQRLYRIYQGDELRIAEKIQQRRYQILIHSCLYYNMNENIVSDVQYDKWAKELEALQKQYPDIADNVDYTYDFKNFSSATGFDLPLNDPWVKRKAVWLSSRPRGSASDTTEPRRVVQEGKLAGPIKPATNQTRKLFSL